MEVRSCQVPRARILLPLCRLPGRVFKRANVIRLAGSASKPAVAQKPLRKHFSGLRPLTFPFSEPGPSPRPGLTFSDDQSFHPPSKKNSGDFFHSGAAPPRPLMLGAAAQHGLVSCTPGIRRRGLRTGRRQGRGDEGTRGQRRGVGGLLALRRVQAPR